MAFKPIAKTVKRGWMVVVYNLSGFLLEKKGINLVLAGVGVVLRQKKEEEVIFT